MATESWARVTDLFHAALQLDKASRAEFLQMQCGSDSPLLQEVLSLLAAHENAGTFIETPITPIVLDAIHQTDEPLTSGDIVGVYKIIKEIGRGGMGAVYLAARADQAYEKYVAIKLLKRGMDTDEVFRHFRNERQILARFDHPNIARLLDGGTSQSGLPYFVMEHVEGMPVDQYCDHHRLTIHQRLELFISVCAAVSYAHRHLVIHRDIKPSNIVVTWEGVPKLLDFGIAKILDTTAEGASTATGIRLMTPEYASPEQILGLPVTTVSDVYSLGVVLYELLSGHPPFQFASRSLVEVARVLEQSHPVPPSEMVDRVEAKDSGTITPEIVSGTRDTTLEHLRRRLRGDLDNIVSMAMRTEAQRRYQSVEQLSEDIRKHLLRLPVRARKDTIVYRMTKFAARNRIAVAAGFLLVLSLFAGVVATLWQAEKAKAEQSRAEFAREFGDEIRYIETLLLSTYTAPLHDIRQNVRLARERLKQIEHRTMEGGPSAYGSGNHALGHGYLMLKDYDLAKLHLENAWNSDYQKPSTAYALGKVMGILWQRALVEADQVSNAEMKKQMIQNAETKYAKPAIQYLARARQNAESPAYVEGLMALYEKRFQEALQKASQALRFSSRPYEIIKLQGDIHFEMGREATTKGDYPGALKSFSLAGNAYARAAENARSDQDIYFADAQRLIRTIAITKTEAIEPVQQALEACDKAIQINPDNDRPYLSKSEVYFQEGVNQLYNSSKDARIPFRMAIVAANEAIKRKVTAAAYDRESQAYLRIGEYQVALNADPRDALKQAIAESEKALQVDPHDSESYLNLAAAHFYIAEYQLTHGEDPTRSYSKVIDTYDNDLRMIPKGEFDYNLLGLANLGIAEYKLKRGTDPGKEFEKAITNYRLGLKSNPNADQIIQALALTFSDIAKHEMNHGIDPANSFDQSVRHYDQGLHLHPTAYGFYNRGVMYESRAEFQIRIGENPEAATIQAMEDFRKTLELHPEFPPALLQIGFVHFIQARQKFAIGKDPSHELTQATQYVTNYLKQDQSTPEAYLIAGRIHFLAGRWAMQNHRSPELLFGKAAIAFKRCMELNQDDISAFVELASVNRRQAEWMLATRQPAEKWINEGLQQTFLAEKINPHNAEILALRGALLLLKSRESKDPALAQEGKTLLQRAIQLNPFLKTEYQSLLASDEP